MSVFACALPAEGTDATATNSDGALTGIGFNSSVLITVNAAVFAPMPNPSVTTTKRTNTGLLRIARPVYRRSR